MSIGWEDRRGDRRLLGAIAIGGLATLAAIALGIFLTGKELSKEAWGLLGVLVGNLASHPQAVISAIKESWLGATINRQGEALHASLPSKPEASQLIEEEGGAPPRRPIPEVGFGREEGM